MIMQDSNNKVVHTRSVELRLKEAVKAKVKETEDLTPSLRRLFLNFPDVVQDNIDLNPVQTCENTIAIALTLIRRAQFKAEFTCGLNERFIFKDGTASGDYMNSYLLNRSLPFLVRDWLDRLAFEYGCAMSEKPVDNARAVCNIAVDYLVLMNNYDLPKYQAYAQSSLATIFVGAITRAVKIATYMYKCHVRNQPFSIEEQLENESAQKFYYRMWNMTIDSESQDPQFLNEGFHAGSPYIKRLLDRLSFDFCDVLHGVIFTYLRQDTKARWLKD